MRVLVTFAVEAEFAPWRRLRNFKKAMLGKATSPSGVMGFSAAVEDHAVEIVLTGMGRAACEGTLAQYASVHGAGPDVVISSGLAGALRSEFKPGSTVAPKRVRSLNNDADTTPDAGLLDKATRTGAIPIETLITAQKLVQTAEEKARLSFFAEAVDMESAYVMSKFARAGVACVTIRTISDAADEDLPIDFDRCLTPQGAMKPMSLVHTIVQRPSRLPKLLRFGRQSNEAIHQLTSFLDGFVAALPKLEVATR